MSNSTSTVPPWRLFNEPPIPSYISEWIALIPLIVHLANPQGDHHLVGELALAGKLTLSLFPKLFHLQGIARLLSGIPDFLDRASSKSDLSSTVWDVDWGSSFSCANGAARDFLTRVALRDVKKTHDLEPILVAVQRAVEASRHVDDNGAGTEVQVRQEAEHDLRRYQTLHVIQIARGKPRNPSGWTKFQKVLNYALQTLILSFLTVFFFLLGAYGTAATVLICIGTQLACEFVPIGRPPGYLENTEDYESACMLSAIHSNASTWYLYVGDRSSIDWLLNKTMISIESQNTNSWARGFRIAHYLQLLAMTFVAGNKNWDGVCLLSLLVVNVIFKMIWEYPAHWAALRWISMSDLKINACSFKLTGRVPMLGAIQMLSASQKRQNGSSMLGDVSWMDDILSPSLRRQVWASKIANLEKQTLGAKAGTTMDSEETALSETDQDWVKENLLWTEETHRCIQEHMMS